jgi:hypothetical protein
MRIFLALLLYEPRLAGLLTEASRQQIIAAPRGGALAEKILALLQDNPNLSSGSLQETFRDEPEEGFVRELLIWATSNMVSSQLEAEFTGTVHKLEQRLTEQRIGLLLDKSTRSALDGKEQDELRTLLRHTGN